MSESRQSEPPERPPTWLDLADDLIDEGVDRDETVEVTVEDLEIDVPLSFDPDGERATWRFDGTVRVGADGHSGPLYAWMQWWKDRVE